MKNLPAGFAKEAESTAEDMRAELGVQNIARLDPIALAAHLQIPVLSLSDLLAKARHVSDLEDAVRLLREHEQGALSAVTVFGDLDRLIVYNDSHDPARRASDLTHEIAHGLLLHPPALALGPGGCRAWDDKIENEASFLGGTLLIPGKGARWSAKRRMSLDETARHFGCSTDMVNWRWNESGARRLMRNG